ncbi:MAG: hypothetical protein A2583_07070 [Bdellovibrionales bacterium RIFOXYD1_FULL_53_11]|nr:MAG: hypothetical protein A2583_07070 [Bdellovibrionales bacterium RIFOXYD1_FULL_53_11]
MRVLETVKTIIAEWKHFKPDPITRRNIEYAPYLETDEVLSIIGPRRSGKSYLCFQIMEDLKKKGVSADNLLYFNFEDERLLPYTGELLTCLYDAYLQLFAPTRGRRVYLFLDEIQNVPGWSKWTRRFLETHPGCKLVLTGSSSKLSSLEIATELRGRTLSIVVFPFDFCEYLEKNNVPRPAKNVLYTEEKNRYAGLFNAYLFMGGFPKAINHPRAEELLREYFRTIFYKDIVERRKIKNIKLLEDFLSLAVDHTSTLASISGISKKLEAIGHSFTKNTISNFVRYAQDAFLVFNVAKHSFKVKEQLRANKKYYCIDNGLYSSIRFTFKEDYGKFLENLVFLELARRGHEIYYHQEGHECDFVVKEKNAIVQAIQVCKTLEDEDTGKREVSGLLEAMKKFNIKTGLILTGGENETIKLEGRTIRVLPAWYWCLSKPVFV